jgi:hypothetical protein
MKTLIYLGLIVLMTAGTSGCWWGWGHRDGDHRGEYHHDEGHHDEGHHDEGFDHH